MKTERFIILLMLMVIPITISSQNRRNENSCFGERYILDKNQVQYMPSPNFSLLKESKNVTEHLNCIVAKGFRGVRPLGDISLLSKDGNFLAYIEIAPIFSSDSIYIDMEMGPNIKWKIDEAYINHIKGDFMMNRWENITSLSKLPIHYKSFKYARKAFNADIVLIYPLKMWETFKEKYNRCQVMIVQKKARGYIAFYCFYNDRGKKKLNQYMKQLEGVFWYREPKDYIEVIKPQIPDTIILPHLKDKNLKK